ncbi:alkaline phosphatase D family protein [Antrihabitans cavernicola]|uniref:Twin-arginine translocation signal domain-containing protein n=1 Tax=Antrihabitans cavernicola TaxID=2495913 RepID=A0A5A7SAW6_9NOCA|nr:alkaline phosphatase D family protein [Spelaeibacter cavernicola]KAA0022439.1 twin-arginine translocation signal domain-containing protein [Spelaeibacter cavernicola]
MGISRRRFLGYGTTGAAAVLMGTGAVASAKPFPTPARMDNPFTLGIASGDPAPDGIVLWTRLAPNPFAPDGFGGMPDAPVTVEYEVARDEGFRHVVRRGSAVATRELGHSVHPEVAGLAPDYVYYYRFRAGDVISPVGRTRTAPLPGFAKNNLKFAFASCQAWNDGFYTAYDHMAAEDLDLVVHLGDYIYEQGLRDNRRGAPVEPQFGGEAFDLARYRLQYARYKAEAPLQLAHSRFPWIVTMDDHEVEDNWAGDISELDFEIDQIPAVFRQRRAAAFQALYEHQPLRAAQTPAGPNMRLHRRIAYGNLAEFTILDTRQYRDDQACGDTLTANCPDRFRSDRTLLGAAQRDWLLGGFTTSAARWQVIGNQVPMGQTDADPGPATQVYTDPWDGYVADRNTVLSEAQRRGVRNLVVITGDRRQNYAADLRRDFSDPNSPVVATEFVGTSITSGGDGADIDDQGKTFLAANPNLKFFNGQRGYVRVHVDQAQWRSDFRVVPYVEKPGAPISTRATYVVEDGAAGAARA